MRLCERKIWHYTHSLNEDGSWGEGVTYGAFAWSNSLLFAHSVRRFTGHDLFDNNRVRQLPQWFMGLLDPSHRNYVPFSNCWNGSSQRHRRARCSAWRTSTATASRSPSPAN